jgi:hypothetical protein
MKRFVIVLITVLALSFFYFFTKERVTGPELRAPIQERYNGGDFTMTLPTGSTPVKVQNSTKSVGEQQMVQNAYSFSNSTVSYRIQVNDYSGHTEGTPEESSRATASQVFNPGYSASFSNSHLGSLSAAATEAEGTTVHGKPVFMKMRIAFSDDHKRMWLAVVTAPDRQSFLAAQADEFMDSVQINSR